MARGGARPGAGRKAGKSANTSPLARARAPAREAAGIQRPWPADKVERWSIDRLIPYAKNARTHTDAQVAAIAASIKEWGWTTPALVGEDGGLIAGHARIPRGNQPGHTDRLQGYRRLAPVAGQRHLLKRLFGGPERRDARLHNQSGELHDTAVFFDHGGRQIIGARRSGRMQPAQNLHALFLRRPAVSSECAPSRGDRAPGILLVGQRDAAHRFAACRADDVHDLAAMGLDERAVDVVRRDCGRNALVRNRVHRGSPWMRIHHRNEATMTRAGEPSSSAA